MDNLKFWFRHNIYCSHSNADNIVNVGDEWDWACLSCEQMLSGSGPIWFWKVWLLRFQAHIWWKIFPISTKEFPF